MITRLLLSLFLCFGIFSKVHSQVYKTVYVDFGPNDVTNGNITKNPDANGLYWNNATDPNTTAAALNLIDINNQITTTSLVISTPLSRKRTYTS